MDPSSDTAPAVKDDKWALYEAALEGARREYYLKHFRRIDAGARMGLSWNWAAMFFTFSWLRYRRMYAYSWVYFFVSTPALFFMLTQFAVDTCAAELNQVWITLPQVILILASLGYLIPPLFANRLYFRFVTKEIAVAHARNSHSDALVPLPQKVAITGGCWGSAAMMTCIVVITVLLPGYADYTDTSRVKISELLLAGSGYKTSAYEFFAANKRLPVTIEEIGGFSGPAGKVKAISLDPSGAIRIVAAFAPLDGRSVLLIPKISGDKLDWTCRSDDIPNKCLPAMCRK